MCWWCEKEEGKDEKSKKKELDSSDVGAGKRKYIGKNSAANARKKKKLQGF